MKISDLRVLMLKYARELSEEEFVKLTRRMEKLIKLTRELTTEISPILTLLGYEPRPGEMEEADAPEPLCSSCANPCQKMGPTVFKCETYYEHIPEKCSKCVYMDESCTLNTPCVGGKFFEPVPEAVTV